MTTKSTNNFNDAPIEKPEEDIFGFNPFAHAISECIRKIDDPKGSVVAIYGPWGSGKSSVINLVLRHLRDSEDDINFINFPAWVYHNEDALIAGFFKEFRIGLSPILSKQKRASDALRKLGIHIAGAGNTVGAAIGLFAGSLGEKVAIDIFKTLDLPNQSDENAEDLQAQLADVLQKEGKRFLVVIDDLDRLAPEEALIIFRLIKSVGRLPNVMYLLAYDRDATEKSVKKKFKSEGAHYLEKIVQAGFEIPNPDKSRLNNMMGVYLDNMIPDLPDADINELRNLFHLVVAPELKTPRDVIRLANTLSIVVNPIKDEVFFPDIMSLETLRIFHPKVYRAIRANKSEILDLPISSVTGNREELKKEFFHQLLGSEAENERERLKKILMRLFPQLQSIFADTSYSEAWRWTQQRRVCSKEHFDSYFRFALSPEAIPRKELDYLLDSKRTIEEIQQRFIESMEVTQAEDRSKASYLLDELTAHGRNVPVSQAELILSAIFPIADKIMDRDKERGFLYDNNRLRIHKLLRAFLLNNTKINQRSKILMRSMKEASLQWLSDFSGSAWENHYPSKPDKEPASEDEVLLTKEDAETLRKRARSRIKAAAIDGTLIDVTDLAHILFEWDVLKADGLDEVHRFTADAIADDQKIVKLARAFLGERHITYASTSGNSPGGTISSHKVDRAQIEDIDQLLDRNKFRKRLRSLEFSSSLSEEQRDIIRRLLRAWEARDEEDSSIPKG